MVHKKFSKREMEVFNLLKAGYRSKEIAKKLNINEKSVSTYILRLKHKCGISKDCNIYSTVVSVQNHIIKRMREQRICLLTPLAVIDSSVPMCYIYDVPHNWTTEQCEEFAEQQGHRRSESVVGMVEDIEDMRDEL